MSLSQQLHDSQHWLVAVTLVLVILLLSGVRFSKEGLFDRNMPAGSNNLAFASLRNDTGSSNDLAAMRGVDGMVGIDQGPSYWGPTSYQEVANDQSAGISAEGNLGVAEGMKGKYGMGVLSVAEGAQNRTAVVLNPY